MIDLSDGRRRVGSTPSEVKADLFEALGASGRVRILEILRDGDRTVAEARPYAWGSRRGTLSQHHAVLRRASVVTTGAFPVVGHATGSRRCDRAALAVARGLRSDSLSANEQLALARLRGDS